MITVVFPRKKYSENKIQLNRIIKKYNMFWVDDKDGWVNEATGDGVFIDKNVMEMIIDDVFSDQPMTMYVKCRNEEFIKEFESNCIIFGGQFIKDSTSESFINNSMPVKNNSQIPHKSKNVFVRLKYRDVSGCNTQAFQEKAYVDLQDISGRTHGSFARIDEIIF